MTELNINGEVKSKFFHLLNCQHDKDIIQQEIQKDGK